MEMLYVDSMLALHASRFTHSWKKQSQELYFGSFLTLKKKATVAQNLSPNLCSSVSGLWCNRSYPAVFTTAYISFPLCPSYSIKLDQGTFRN